MKTLIVTSEATANVLIGAFDAERVFVTCPLRPVPEINFDSIVQMVPMKDAGEAAWFDLVCQERLAAHGSIYAAW